MARKPKVGATKHDVALAGIRHRTYVKAIDRGAQTLKIAITGGITLFSASEIAGAAKTIADGKIPWSSIGNAILNGSVGTWVLSVALTMVSGSLAVYVRTSRRALHEKNNYIRQLETKVDPERTSSRLLPNGNPTKEDKNDE